MNHTHDHEHYEKGARESGHVHSHDHEHVGGSESHDHPHESSLRQLGWVPWSGKGGRQVSWLARGDRWDYLVSETPDGMTLTRWRHNTPFGDARLCEALENAVRTDASVRTGPRPPHSARLGEGRSRRRGSEGLGRLEARRLDTRQP